MTNYIILAATPVEFMGLLHALLSSAAFGVLGLILMVAGFKMFEWVTGRMDIEQQLANQNVAVGIVVAALLLGISLIVVVSMT